MKPPRRAMGQFSCEDVTGDRDAGAAADELSGEVATTIVGGQPRGRRPVTVTVNVPVNVERVLYLAATDEAFRQALLEQRDEAARARGFALRDSEAQMLRLAPEATLLASIESLDTSRENVGRRGFMQAVAVSAVTIAAGGAATALPGCDDGRTVARDMDIQVPPRDSAGIDIQVPPPDSAGMTDQAVDVRLPDASAGIDVQVPSPDSAGIRDQSLPDAGTPSDGSG